MFFRSSPKGTWPSCERALQRALQRSSPGQFQLWWKDLCSLHFCGWRLASNTKGMLFLRFWQCYAVLVFRRFRKQRVIGWPRWCHSCTPCCLRQVLNPRVSAAMEMAISGETLRPVVFFCCPGRIRGQLGCRDKSSRVDTIRHQAQKSKERAVHYTTMQCGHVFWLSSLVFVINLPCWWQAKAYQNEHAQTSRQTDSQPVSPQARQTGRQTGRERDRQTERDTQTHTHIFKIIHRVKPG